ncbi:O-methyltransferase [Aquitalea sp. LB_tupeE]|uniref:O-methyltransferase n=1 Tax=Aquitalea sp. LB_tupeE TaxID=2748078 RepID=UPI0015BF4918|nr:class I SAM-dependent methyltransferase [Aquitalea sp. LB_tupeE]NWK79613.1 class I SAM-dependent methyltransferase [Aquitalea sp. LB_tupeE]
MLSTELFARLHAIWEEGEHHDAVTTERALKNLFITPDTGRFLYQLLRHANPQHVLEIGTSNGYSTLWLALALRDGDGRISSLDVLPAKQQQAAQHLQDFALQHKVDLHCMDAAVYLHQAAAGSVDVVFLDADRSRYVDYWPDLCRILRHGGLIVVDNVLSHPDECADFIRLVLATEGYLAETYQIGKGQFVIVKD